MAREPARTPYAARARYVRIISLPLTCVTRAVWCDAPTIRGTDEDLAISLTGFPSPVRLRRENSLPVFLTAVQSYQLVPDERFATGEWKASTRGYAYTLYDVRGHQPTRALAWHWHPGSGKSEEPHIHVYRDGEIGGVLLDKLHLPAERVAFESVIRFAIEELGVTPKRDDWRDLIDSALDRFVRFRTWPRSGGPLTATEADSN